MATHYNLQIKIQRVDETETEAYDQAQRRHVKTAKKGVLDLLDFKTQLPKLSQIKAMARASVDMVPDEAEEASK